MPLRVRFSESYWLIDEVGVATVPGSSFYASDPALVRGLVRFAFPKKDETFAIVEKRFEKLQTLR
jgi:aminotransferase